MAMISSCMHEDDGNDTYGYGYGYDQYHSHRHNLSRLSMCTSSMCTDDDGMNMFMSKLSIESFDCDADEEFSDEIKVDRNRQLLDSSDSDKDPSCYSLPATPPRRRASATAGGVIKDQLIGGVKHYASENDLRKNHKRKNLKKRKAMRQSRVAAADNFSEESESGAAVGGGGDGGVMVITRPKGGSRSLCMDLGEVRACKDLGFELEHERMFPSGRISRPGSTLDTASSGGDSPIASWRISSPGDDPRDVKARLKVWAQAVAIASTSRHGH